MISFGIINDKLCEQDEEDGDIPGLGTVHTPYTQSWHLGKSFLLDIVYIVTHIKSK